MKRLLLALFLLSAVGALAQNAPVTINEVNAVLSKVDAGVRKVIGLKTGPTFALLGTRAATRAEIILALDKMAAAYRPRFRYTPRPFRTERAVIESFNPDPKVREALIRLSKLGCVGTVGPLVVGPGDGIGPEEFAEAVGYFVAQISSLTYFADPRFVPNLQYEEPIGD